MHYTHCHGGRPCKNEAEYITPGGSPSNSTYGEGKDEAKDITSEGSPNNSTNGEGRPCKGEAEHIPSGDSTNENIVHAKRAAHQGIVGV